MRTSLFILASAATLAVATPAMSQVYFGADDRGVHVGVGDGDRYHHRRVYRDYDEDTYARGSCREIRSKTYTPDGRVVYRTKRVCD